MWIFKVRTLIQDIPVSTLCNLKGSIFSSFLPFGNRLNIIWQSFGPANGIAQAFKGLAYPSVLGR
jgi:hypothetical protein